MWTRTKRVFYDAGLAVGKAIANVVMLLIYH